MYMQFLGPLLCPRRRSQRKRRLIKGDAQRNSYDIFITDIDHKTLIYGKHEAIGDDNVAVPTHLYKVIMVTPGICTLAVCEVLIFFYRKGWKEGTLDCGFLSSE